MLTKVQRILKLKPTEAEKELFVSSMFMKDRLAVDIISLDANEAVVNENDIKKYWDEHKTDYLTQKSYDLDTITIGLSTKSIDEKELETFYKEKRHNYKSSEGKILTLIDARVNVEKDYRLKLSKREALETYLLFKKSQMNATGTKNVQISDSTFPVDKLANVKVGEVLKPIETADGYIVIKVKSINEPLPRPYADAKAAILIKLQADKKSEALAKKAESRLQLFKGKDIGFVSRDSATKINGLSETESLEFINFVFDNNKDRNFKVIGNKAILYQILEQNLLDTSKVEKYTSLVNDNIAQMKQAEIGQNLVTNLKKRYDIEQYYKGN